MTLMCRTFIVLNINITNHKSRYVGTASGLDNIIVSNSLTQSLVNIRQHYAN